MAFQQYNYVQALMIIIVIFEAFLVKINFDFINYEHDYKYYLHRLPKVVFYVGNVVCNIIVICSMILIKSNLKYIVLATLLFANFYHIIYKKNQYTLPLMFIITNAQIAILGYSNAYIIVMCISALYGVALAFFLKHKATKIYTYDNY